MILERVGLKNVHDVYQVDVDSPQFGCLPKHVQYEVLNDLKGKKKQNSWTTIHQMPREAENFSAFQFERLKRRRQIEAKLTNVKDLIKASSSCLDLVRKMMMLERDPVLVNRARNLSEKMK